MHNQATFLFLKKEIKFGKRSIGLFQNMNEITKKISDQRAINKKIELILEDQEKLSPLNVISSGAGL